MLTIYNAVVCVMCIPANFIVFKLRPSIFLPISEIGWGVFTFAQAGAQSYQQMYVFRFFVAFFEGFYVSMVRPWEPYADTTSVPSGLLHIGVVVYKDGVGQANGLVVRCRTRWICFLWVSPSGGVQEP